MTTPLTVTSFKLWFLAVVSTLLCVGGPHTARAHEVLPTIADMTQLDDGRLVLELRINLESFLADIDLDTLSDTDDAPAAAEYDRLRALDPVALAEQVPEVVAAWNAHPLVASETAIPLEVTSVTVPSDIDFELPRVSVLALTSASPVASHSVVVAWPAGSGALVLRQQGVENPYTGYLDGGQSTPEISLAGGDAQTPMQAFVSYIPVGFDHILPKGLDHILFVLGLFFLSTKWGPLLWQVSAFTLAHTVTLALGAMGWVSIPGSIVEPLIAISIVYVALENLYQRKLSRWRPLVIFGFGLLHGLGFASVLGEFGLPQGQFVPALIGFNVGVELGQLTVIAAAGLILALCARLARHSQLSPAEEPAGRYPVMFRAVSVPASLIIAVIGAYWSVERVFL